VHEKFVEGSGRGPLEGIIIESRRRIYERKKTLIQTRQASWFRFNQGSAIKMQACQPILFVWYQTKKKHLHEGRVSGFENGLV
jgi:hypothetical protein